MKKDADQLKKHSIYDILIIGVFKLQRSAKFSQ